MKKNLLVLLSLLIIGTGCDCTFAKDNYNDLSNAIQLYKQGNYSQCYVELEEYVQNDPSNAVAYYYLGMTYAQLGRGSEAVANYDKAIELTSKTNKLNHYARKGKRCIETPDKCNSAFADSGEDMYILNSFGSSFSEEAKSQYEQLQIENLRREMNRDDIVEPQKFQEYKEFSSVPTNDEIVAALRTLQNAGFNNVLNHNNNDLSFLTNTQQSSIYSMMGNQNMNPQLIQTLLTNSITQGF